MIKTLAQLKRDLKPGAKVKTIYHLNCPSKIGEVREVSKIQSNKVAFRMSNGQDSWLSLDKANNFIYEDNIFKIVFDNTIYGTYEIL